MKLTISDAGGPLQELGVDADGVSLPSSGSSNTVPRDGWISFTLDSTGLPPEGVPFELQCSYTGTGGI
jgi:hypothetical protein